MKRRLTLLLVMFGIMAMGGKTVSSQTVSYFENLTLVADTFWNGSDGSSGFISGNAFFTNEYNFTYSIWSAGFAYSNMKDSLTVGYTNMYSARPASGALGSSNYAIGQQGAVLRLTGAASGKVVQGMFVANDTYAALSMRDGDAFAKKFGGLSGNDPDWFRLAISGYYNGAPVDDSVYFYLADYRFANNALDYIVDDWQWVDLTPLGNLDSLSFTLASSDTGQFGMNTPPFFCLDNFTTANSGEGIVEIDDYHLQPYPNPASYYILINNPTPAYQCEVVITDLAGRIILSKRVSADSIYNFDLRNFADGLYLIRLAGERKLYTARFVKCTK